MVDNLNEGIRMGAMLSGEPGGSHDSVRVIAWVHGHVQGVGFRWWVRSQALELGLVGSATNYPDGRVLVCAEGGLGPAAELLARLREDPSSSHRPGSVDTVLDSWHRPRGGYRGFEIR